jgi:hypothetical protein
MPYVVKGAIEQALAADASVACFSNIFLAM